MQYRVITCHDVTVYDDVEADSPDEAMEKADGHLALCCQCPGEVGEVTFIIVLDENGNEVHEEDLSHHPPCASCSSKG